MPTTGNNRTSVVMAFLFSVVAIIAMRISDVAAKDAIKFAAWFFGTIAIAIELIQSGIIPQIVINGQQEKTKRMQVELYRPTELPKPEPVYIGTVDPMQPLAERGRFVPAIEPVERHVRIEAINWIGSLYNGPRLNPKMVLPKESNSPGKIQPKAPSKAATEYLINVGILRRGKNSYYWNLPLTSSPEDVYSRLNAHIDGVPG